MESRKSRSDIAISLILYAVVFVSPLFILPIGQNPLSFGKAIFIYSGTVIVLLIWLISKLKTGKLSLPRSPILLSLLGIIIVWAISSFFSFNIPLSLIGYGHEVGTTAFFLFLSLALFFSSIVFSNESKASIFYFLIFLSGLLVLIIQIAHTVFSLPIPYFDSALIGKTGNLIGGWNDFGIFFGFLGISALSIYEFLSPKFSGETYARKLKPVRMVLLGYTILSFIILTIVNFKVLSYIFGFAVLVLLVYLFSRSFFEHNNKEKIDKKEPTPLFFSFFTLLAVFFLIIASNFASYFSAYLGTASLDVRPSFETSMGVVRQVLTENPLLGSGPATFLYDWLSLKPQAVNGTVFWNARFEAGISHFVTMFATAGILGGLAIIVFLVVFVSQGIKAITYSLDHKIRALLMTSFFGSLYLWAIVVFYSSGFFVYALAFISTGVFVGLMVSAGKTKMVEISFLESPKKGFLSTLVTIILIISSLSGFYLLFQKTWSAYAFTKGVEVVNKEGNIDKAKNYFLQAVSFDNRDAYLRGLTEINILEIQRILNRTDLNPEEARAQFQTALGTAIQNAREATRVNSLDPLNWFELSRIYELIVPLRVERADEASIEANMEALKRSPFDPSAYLVSARVKIQSGKNEEAREYIAKALELKNDFTQAIFLLAQLENQSGNTEAAILRTEQTAVLAPNDVGVLFQLGLFHYQKKNYERAGQAFERAVSLNPGYANARYFLGLIYDKQGKTEEAISQFQKIQETNPGNAEVKNILENLISSRSALDNISPPSESPEKRDKPPVKEDR